MTSLSTFLLIFICSLTTFSADKVITQTVGVAGGRIITSREVQILSLLERIIYPGKAKQTIDIIEIKDKSFISEVNSTIFEWILNIEAEKFALAQINKTDLDSSVEQVKKTLRSKEFWAKLEVSEQELDRLVRQKMVAKSYLAFKTSLMTSVVSDSDALAYFEKNKIKFGNVNFEVMKPNIKTFLVQRQLEERLKSYFEVIKREYKARNILAEINGV